jgi:hypothetical protein
VAFNTDVSEVEGGPSVTRDVDAEVRSAMIEVFRSLGASTRSER